MTDKEQKKWHEQKWRTNEEPEETPTERPYCVDISIKNQDKEQIIIDDIDVSKCEHITYKNSFNPMCGNTGICCYGRKNCYFKQLARKTQVIDEIEEVIKPYQEQIELDALSLPIAIESILERKTQECEELKEQLQVNQPTGICETCTAKAILQNGKYHKALEEIEQELKEDIYCESQECGCDDFEECLKCTKDLILNIIDKAKQGTMSK